ncbi:GNAT family N-acetyltransferase [Antarcticibacterium sp. 1MA-6-2]|uniref:GNAT family N-acetyltransferase n=1 Tax=Antarcticibacterium sp. 1MA-6-2 TaxID=2908210 RepID=UPI001F1A7E01|nr:GNAT family N-acetyltransferase [Antarcticibacterium sp. 1MA-6-2]UJH91300.1 GNAT family N-acetyltransferase [Antarcticibacterium sp. 1MA-6-2]
MELKRYKEGDEEQILELFELAFKKKLSKEFWLWRFKNNPFLDPEMINLMWEDDVLAGHYAVSALEMVVGDKEVLASLSGTTMTHPSFQGKGIFSTLSLELYDRVNREHGVNMVLGFPNKNSHYGLVKKIEWKDVAIVPNLSLSTGNLKKTVLTTSVKNIETFDDSHSGFIKNIISELGFSVSVSRSTKYLNWRYRDCPINDYSCLEISKDGACVGVVITKIFQPDPSTGPELDIVDLFCAPDLKLLQEILIHVDNHYSEKGLTDSNFNLWMSLFDPRHLLMERLGFSPGMPLTYMCTKEFSEGFSQIADYRNWYISMGDSDIF